MTSAAMAISQGVIARTPKGQPGASRAARISHLPTAIEPPATRLGGRLAGVVRRAGLAFGLVRGFVAEPSKTPGLRAVNEFRDLAGGDDFGRFHPAIMAVRGGRG